MSVARQTVEHRFDYTDANLKSGTPVWAEIPRTTRSSRWLRSSW